MKIAFISDIHGNGTALDAVLDDIKKKEINYPNADMMIRVVRSGKL